MTIKIFSYFAVLFLASTAVMGDDRGCYTIPNYGQKKQAVLNNGGGTLELAIAMLETNDMGTDYNYGDGKTYDSANFGIFKQNWFMLRTSTSQFKGQTTDEWNNGAVLNSNLWDDIHARQDSQNYYGIDKWFGGHRDGESGVNNPYTDDINTYKNGVYWIQDQITANNNQYMYDDTRCWVNVTPI
ncbi:hypothetical protein BC941DRAFT_356296 [Chlamydoabsidia padenii]|nr:hypothetical protein BC941DRAFT_356296 [Chlamydoabsidia padenii]